MGGRLKLSTARHPQDVLTEPERRHRSRVQQVRLLLVVALVGSAAIHAAVIPEHLAEWTAAGLFFIMLSSGELAVAGLVLAPGRVRQRTALLAATAISVAPLLLWLYSRTAGLPFGPEAGIPENAGVPDGLACSLEVGSLLAAIVLLRSTRWLARRPPTSAHVHGLAVVALICMTVIAVSGTGLSWFDAFGISASHSATGVHH
jgi:hypothetical protein